VFVITIDYKHKIALLAARSSIVGEPLQPDAWQKIQLKEAEMNKVPEMFVDTTPQQAPVFTTHLVSHDKLVEGQHVMLEAQVEPRADPNLRIEWFKNGISLTTGTYCNVQSSILILRECKMRGFGQPSYLSQWRL
jgi:hypothetical protein